MKVDARKAAAAGEVCQDDGMTDAADAKNEA
jgi:hypothetical protein